MRLHVMGTPKPMIRGRRVRQQTTAEAREPRRACFEAALSAIGSVFCPGRAQLDVVDPGRDSGRCMPISLKFAVRACVTAMLAIEVGCARTPSGDCTSFTPMSIADIRRAGVNGCFEVVDAVVEGRTASPSSPRIFATDAIAGAGSAIVAKCSADTEPHCSNAAAAAVAKVLRGAIVTMRGYYWKSARSGLEELVLQELDDSGLLAEPPAPVKLSLADATRATSTRDAWFHYVSIDIPANDPLQVSDISPPELVRTSCPKVSGFALRRAADNAPPVGCDGTVNPPSGVRDPDAVLIGRAFFHDFSWSTDCECALAHHQHLLSNDASFAGELRGILAFAVPLGGTSGWQILEPLSNADLPLILP